MDRLVALAVSRRYLMVGIYAAVLSRLYPSAMRPGSAFDARGVSPGSYVHPTARLEHGVTVDPGAVVGPGAEIGSGTLVGAQAVICPRVMVGRDCSIGSGATVSPARAIRTSSPLAARSISSDSLAFASAMLKTWSFM